MKKITLILTITSIFLLFTTAITYSQDLTASDILKKTDSVITAMKDVKSKIKTVLIDKDKNEKIRESESFEKGKDKRLVRFISPADQKGIAFLSLPNDVQYVYLPAFHKVRRIASSAKNTNFAGTDFTYDDLSTFEYSPLCIPKLLETNNETYILELTPKPDVKKDYSKLKMWIRKDNFYPIKYEMYDKNGKLWKILERRKIEKVGNYWVSKEMEMKDVKANHATKMIIEKIEVDTGLPDDIFTERNLSKMD
ncbi:MAG: outer membrane lipoprotein-sorting protein [Candidatus Poribacteria bacterium]